GGRRIVRRLRRLLVENGRSSSRRPRPRPGRRCAEATLPGPAQSAGAFQRLGVPGAISFYKIDSRKPPPVPAAGSKREQSRPATVPDAPAPRSAEILWRRDFSSSYGRPRKRVAADGVPRNRAGLPGPRRDSLPRLVDFPEGDCDEVMRDFYNIGKFPSVTGCIDCTHVKIKGPGGPNGEVFRNRKGFFSLNVQAITGPQLQFFDIVARWPGSVHDSRIFDNSRARVLYENQRIPGLLLGDAGYACMSFLLTPLTSPVASITNAAPYRYQAAHLKTRNSVERAFGVFKRRFPCLDMRLQYKAERSALIITACAALHKLA
ncbi:unnamed protein product, partial [Ixodes pacificus]